MVSIEPWLQAPSASTETSSAAGLNLIIDTLELLDKRAQPALKRC
jgi:hypothetical protein